jgi:hypothetical protein
MKTLKALLSIAVLVITVILVQSFFPHNSGLIYGILIFTAPGGIATPFAFNMTYLPQFITFNNVVPLTSLRVETQEDGVLHDWLAASIAVINGFMIKGAQAANQVVLRIADGHIRNKNVTISGVTSAAGAVPFFVSSDKIGSFAYKTTNAAILALNPTTFRKFTAIWAPTMAAGTDRAEILYLKGHKQICETADLANLSSLYQEVPQIMVNNVNAYIDEVTFTCAAATPAYVLSVNI